MDSTLLDAAKRYTTDAAKILDKLVVEFAESKKAEFPGANLVALHAFAHAAEGVAQFVHEGLSIISASRDQKAPTV